MNYLQLDINPLQEGHIIASCSKATTKKLKLKVIRGKNSLHYDIKDKECIPLQFGNGRYSFELYENTKGAHYVCIGKRAIDVQMADVFAPFLHSNQYVSYTNESAYVIKAQELCADKETANDKFAAIENFIKKKIAYNYVKALTVKKATLPNIDECYEKSMGICQDIAALMVAMLRSQNIPCSLVIGYADKQYHAWIKVYWNKNKVQSYDPTAWILKRKNAKSYTEERWY